MKYYCGLDVSLNSTAVCIVNHDGTIIREGEVPSEPAAIDQWLKNLGLPIVTFGDKPACFVRLIPALRLLYKLAR